MDISTDTEGPGTVRQRPGRKERIREQLTMTAWELFERNGFDETTVTEVTQRVGVTERTFYNHFTSKVDVLFPRDADRVPSLVRMITDEPLGTSDFDALAKAGIRWLHEPIASDTALQHSMGRTRLDISQRSLIVLNQRVVVQAEFVSTMVGALARRHGLDEPTIEHRVLGSVLGAVLQNAYTEWLGRDALEAFPDIARAHLGMLRSAVIASETV